MRKNAIWVALLVLTALIGSGIVSGEKLVESSVVLQPDEENVVFTFGAGGDGKVSLRANSDLLDRGDGSFTAGDYSVEVRKLGEGSSERYQRGPEPVMFSTGIEDGKTYEVVIKNWDEAELEVFYAVSVEYDSPGFGVMVLMGALISVVVLFRHRRGTSKRRW